MFKNKELDAVIYLILLIMAAYAASTSGLATLFAAIGGAQVFSFIWKLSAELLNREDKNE